MEAGSITVKIKGDTTDLQTAFNQLNDKLNGTKKNTESLFGSLLKFEVLKNVFMNVSNVIIETGKSFIQSASNVENLNASFTTMLGNAEKARNLTSQLRQLAASTPFGTEDLAKATQTMLAFGINQKDVIKNLNMLGDVAGNSREKLGSLALVFGQISSAGKLQGQDLMQLINVGFNPLQVISEKTGESMSSLRQKMEKGQISIDLVKDAFKTATSEGGRFFKNMETQSQTLTGKISTMQDEITLVGSTIGTAMLPFLKGLVDETTKAAQSIGQFVTSIEGMELINTIINNISFGFKVFKIVVSELSDNLKNVFIGAFDSVVNGFKLLFSELGKGNTGISIFAGALNVINAGIAILSKVITFVINGLFNWWNVLKQLGGFIVTFWSGYGNTFITGFQSLIKVFQSLFDAVKKIGENVPKILDSIFKRDWKEVARLTDETVGSISNIAKTVADSVKNTSDSVNQAIQNDLQSGKNIADAMKKFGKDSLSDFKAIVLQTISEVNNAGGNIEDVIKKISNAYKDAMSSVGGGKLDGGGGGETPTGKPTANTTIKKIEISLDVESLTNSVSEASNIIGNFTNQMVLGIIGGITNISNAFVDMKTVLENVASTMAEKMAAVGKTVSSIATSIGAAITSVFDMVNQSIANSFQERLNAVKSVHEQELQAIQDKLDMELELIENDGKTKEEKRAMDMESLQAQLLAETDEKKKADLQEQISALKKESAIEAAKKKADQEKAKSDYKAAKAAYDLQKQQFEISQAMQIVQATISYALGLVQLWSNVWSLGPIAGAILGGIMTGVLTGIFASQVALISSAKFPGQAPTPPAFAIGTQSFSGGRALVGEAGAEQVNLPAGSEILPAGLSSWNAPNQTINLIVDGSILKTWLVSNLRSESLYS